MKKAFCFGAMLLALSVYQIPARGQNYPIFPKRESTIKRPHHAQRFPTFENYSDRGMGSPSPWNNPNYYSGRPFPLNHYMMNDNDYQNREGGS
jgi:hypothetical protein